LIFHSLTNSLWSYNTFSPNDMPLSSIKILKKVESLSLQLSN